MYYELLTTDNPFEFDIYYCAYDPEEEDGCGDCDLVAKIVKRTDGWYEVQSLRGTTFLVQKFLLFAFEAYLSDKHYSLVRRPYKGCVAVANLM